MTLSLFVTVPKGMESLLVEELKSLGITELRATRAGVSVDGSLETAYRICLWSRLAGRVLLLLDEFIVESNEDLYDAIRRIDWQEHLAADGTLAVDVNAAESRVKHTHYAALKVKDGVVDQFRERFGTRPSVDLERPSIRLNVNIHKNRARLSLDLSGQSLHRRGYRDATVLAPMKENLAAAILLQLRWPERLRAGAPLIDPMCGSGTLPIEAAWMATDTAPGLLREYYGFVNWKGHAADTWLQLLQEARDRQATAAGARFTVIGYDSNRTAVRAALTNIARAGLTGKVHIERKEFQLLDPIGKIPGMLVVNPPYGERLGQDSNLPKLYQDLGAIVRRRFPGWTLAIFTANVELVHRLRLTAKATTSMYNGAIPAKLIEFPVEAGPTSTGTEPDCHTTVAPTGASGVDMFANRLRKNWRTSAKWAKRNAVNCFRVYDADLPEFAVAIDYYSGVDSWVHVQEYRAPSSVDPVKAAERLAGAMNIIPQVLEVSASQVHLKVRERQKGAAQYGKLAGREEFHIVHEADCRFLVNFTDYLDTGLFLDHRPMRALLRQRAEGKAFLNLFAYTGTATVAAVAGGAIRSTTVDLSTTYLDWAQRNLALNQLAGDAHEFVRADCRDWLAKAVRDRRLRYGLVFIDPPTFSNSKRMEGTLDVQRDHVELIRDALALLSPGGELYFSTNRQRFRLNAAEFSGWQLEDLSMQTIPEDFRRHPTVHRCWRFRKI